MPVCCSTTIFGDVSPTVAIELLLELGLRRLEVTAALNSNRDSAVQDDWLRAASEAGCLIPTVRLVEAGPDSQTATLASAKTLEKAIHVLDGVRHLGAKVLVVRAGNEGTPSVADEDHNLLRLADRAGELGVRIALDTAGRSADSRSMLTTLRTLKHDNIGIHFDTTGYLYLNPGANGEIALQRVVPHLASMRLTDSAASDHRPDGSALGHGGAVDFARTWEILRACEFDGPATIEVRPRRAGRAALRDCLAQSLAHLRDCGWFDREG